MKIAVIAANGRSGRAFLKEALDRGHSINAGVHNINHANLKMHHNLSIVPCDATRIEDIKNLIKGQDAVVSLIGHVKGSPADVQTKSIQNIIQAMDELGIKRLISLTGTGVRFPGDKITLIDRFLNLSISTIDPKRIKDGKDHVNVIKASDTDWTLIRVLKLQDTKPSKYKLTENGPTRVYVGRSTVARAIIEVLEQSSFIKKAPIIS